MSAAPSSFTHACGGIDWYVEQRGAGPHIVLIPSGEGDCGSFDTVAADLARDFTVTAFDTPGFSRSSVADPAEISGVKLAGQIAALVRSLGIKRAAFYGCSSGGLATLDLAVHHADLVDVAIVHESALPDHGTVLQVPPMAGMDDAAILALMIEFTKTGIEDQVAWKALGPEYHARLAPNLVTWVRRYWTGEPRAPIDPSSLAGRPIVWTIGGLSMFRMFFNNVVLAHRAGIDLGMLPCMHFPQVTIPGELAAHIRASVARH